MSFLSHFPNLVGLGLKSLQINDKEVTHVGRLNALTWLDLDGTNVSYEGLQSMKGLLIMCVVSQLTLLFTWNVSPLQFTYCCILDKKLTHFSLPDRLGVDNRCITLMEGL